MVVKIDTMNRTPVGHPVADPGMSWGGKGLVGYMFSYAKGAKCLVMPLCLGPGVGKGIVRYMFSYAKGAKCLVMAVCLHPWIHY